MKRFYRLPLLMFAVLALTSALSACGDDDAAGVTVRQVPGEDVGFGDGTVVVIDGDTYVVTGDPKGECVTVAGECIQVDGGTHCNEDGAQVDVIVVDGEVVEVICYPSPQGGTPVEEIAGDGPLELPQNQSGTVITFSEDSNGEPFEGNVTLEAERTTLYGNGPGNTILDGNVLVESNNSRVRGVTINGNLVYPSNANNSAAAFCEIQGNLEVDANGFTVTDCKVWGNVQIDGNNAVLVGVGVQGEWNVPNNALCDGCYSFSDDDGDFVVAESEVGDPLTCGGM